jgi:hypothetical protein
MLGTLCQSESEAHTRDRVRGDPLIPLTPTMLTSHRRRLKIPVLAYWSTLQHLTHCRHDRNVEKHSDETPNAYLPPLCLLDAQEQK